MRKMTGPGLAILLGGLALLTSGDAVRADFLPSYTCCPTAMTVCRHPSPGLKLLIPSRPACCPCAVHYYGTCWHDAVAPDYNHCQTAPSCVSSSHPISLPLVPTPDRLPAPAKEQEADLPKPRRNDKPEAKPDANPEAKPDAKPEAKPQAMNIIYHPNKESPFAMQLWRPIAVR